MGAARDRAKEGHGLAAIGHVLNRVELTWWRVDTGTEREEIGPRLRQSLFACRRQQGQHPSDERANLNIDAVMRIEFGCEASELSGCRAARMEQDHFEPT